MLEIIASGEQHPKETKGFGFEFEDGDFLINLPNSEKYKLSSPDMEYIESPADGVYAYQNDNMGVDLHLVEQTRKVNMEKKDKNVWMLLFNEEQIEVIFPEWAEDNKISFIPLDEIGELDFIGRDNTSYRYENEKGQVYTMNVKKVN